MQTLVEIQNLESFEMAKVDVIEERLNNHIKFFWGIIAFFGAALLTIGGILIHMNGQLGRLDSLDSIGQKLTKLELNSQASLPQSAFDKALPEIKSTVATARKDRISVPPAVIEGLRDKLLASNSNAPDFWPTIAEFISYRSLIQSPPPRRPLGQAYYAAIVPTCTDSFPAPMKVTAVLSPHEIAQSRGIYENCLFVLDSPDQDQRINTILNTRTPYLTFKNCLIEYRGGEINLILAWDKMPFTITLVPPTPEDKTPPEVHQTTLSGPAIEFENCMFDFSLQGPPPEKGQQISTTLLAQNMSSVMLPVAK
jgi:hypothetical protein